MHLLLQAAQHATQMAAPVYVTLQPSPAGMPEWVKILISASIGSLFGVISTLGMEYVKPYIARRVFMKMMLAHIGQEVIANLIVVDNSLAQVRDCEKKDDLIRAHKFNQARQRLAALTSEKYDFYLLNDRKLMFASDRDNLLAGIYNKVKVRVPEMIHSGRDFWLEYVLKELALESGTFLKMYVLERKYKALRASYQWESFLEDPSSPGE